MHTLSIEGDVGVTPYLDTRGAWPEQKGSVSLLVNLSAHVPVTSDTARVLKMRTDQSARTAFSIASPLSGRVGDGQLRMDMIVHTSTRDGIPACHLAGSASLTMDELAAAVGRDVELELSESSDPDTPRGKLVVHITRADVPRTDGAGAPLESVSSTDMRKLIQRSMGRYYAVPPAHKALRAIHTPSMDARIPAGFYIRTQAHVASQEGVWAQLLRVGCARAHITEHDFVASIEHQRNTAATGSNELAAGMHDAAAALALAVLAVPTAETYMTDHRRLRSKRWSLRPGDQSAEQFLTALRATGSGDCEDKAHDTALGMRELAHGPGAMAGPAGEWVSPLVRAAGWLAEHGYETLMVTWAVASAALAGGPSSADDDVICHIGAVAFPRARLVSMAVDGRAVDAIHKSAEGWTAGLHTLVMEGTGHYWPDFQAVSQTDRAAHDVRGGVEKGMDDLDVLTPMLHARAGPDASPFYKYAVSGYGDFARGVVDVWFGSRGAASYGVSARELVEGDAVWGPCLQLSEAEYAACDDYAKSASVPPCMYPPGAPSPSLVAKVDAFNDTHNKRVDGVCSRFSYYMRAEKFEAGTRALARLSDRTRAMHAVVEPLVKGVATVRVDVCA